MKQEARVIDGTIPVMMLMMSLSVYMVFNYLQALA